MTGALIRIALLLASAAGVIAAAKLLVVAWEWTP